MIRRLVLLAVILFGGGSAHAQVPPDFVPGSALHDVYCRACAHFYPEVLPADSAFRLDRAVCGTSAVMGILAHWERLPRSAKEAFAFLQQRPVLRESILSSEGHFKIHYNTVGIDAVDPTDADGNGTPDYVDEAARAFEDAWDLQIDQMGYLPPPSDGDGAYDIYIKNLARQGAYGYTYPIAYPETITPSYMEIDNNFTDAIYRTRGLDGLRVTAAHEFFHAVQFAYYADYGAAWWQELTATWMEDVAYPAVDDFYQYMRCSSIYSCFYDTPELSLAAGLQDARLHAFGAAVFAHHVEQIYGADAIKNVWAHLKRRDPSTYRLSLIDEAMPLGGFAQVMPRFSAWNYLTDIRARAGYYTEARDLPSIAHAAVFLGTGGSHSGSATVDHLGATYIAVPTSSVAGGLRGEFALDADGEWTLLVLLISQSGVELLWPRGTVVVIPDANRFDEVAFIAMETSLSGEGRRVDYTLSTGGSTATDLVGDLDGDGRVALSDCMIFADGLKLFHADEAYDPRLDLNGDGPIDARDFLILASHSDFQLPDDVLADLAGGVDATTLIEIIDLKTRPEEFALEQNVPNPFNASTTIRYRLPAAVEVNLAIYNLLGQEVHTLVWESKDAGFHSVVWDGLDKFGKQVGSGVYIYRLSATDFTQVRRMMLLK